MIQRMQELRRKVWRPKAVAPKFETCLTNLDAAIWPRFKSTTAWPGRSRRLALRLGLIAGKELGPTKRQLAA